MCHQGGIGASVRAGYLLETMQGQDPSPVSSERHKMGQHTSFEAVHAYQYVQCVQSAVQLVQRVYILFVFVISRPAPVRLGTARDGK